MIPPTLQSKLDQAKAGAEVVITETDISDFLDEVEAMIGAMDQLGERMVTQIIVFAIPLLILLLIQSMSTSTQAYDGYMAVRAVIDNIRFNGLPQFIPPASPAFAEVLKSFGIAGVVALLYRYFAVLPADRKIDEIGNADKLLEWLDSTEVRSKIKDLVQAERAAQLLARLRQHLEYGMMRMEAAKLEG